VIYGRRKQDEPPPVGPFQLLQNYPNPFNASTVIRYRLEKSQVIRIDIYNARGQHIRRLVEGNMPAGEHRAIWDGHDERLQQVGSGVYFCRIIGENFSESIKLLYLK
jgi:flagellar hook assembly protein FlgD